VRKRPVIYVSLVVLLLTLGMGGCAKRPKTDTARPLAAPASAPMAKAPAKNIDRTGWPVIVAFGDSLTYGQGVDADHNYPAQLQAELDRKGYKFRVVNAGISGDTTSGGANRVETVLKLKPQIVLLELGANDGLQGKSVEQMRQNLTQVIEQLQQAKVTVVLMGMQIPPNYGPEYTAAFQQTFTDLAKRYKLPLVPFFLDGVGGKPALNLPDGIHPTAEGYVYVVKNVMAVLEPLLK
jgi:acyl-CoA thioesterase I